MSNHTAFDAKTERLICTSKLPVRVSGIGTFSHGEIAVVPVDRADAILAEGHFERPEPVKRTTKSKSEGAE